METSLMKALAMVLLEPRTDQWGNKIESPLSEAITKWAYDKRDDIASAIVKNLGVEVLAEKVALKTVEELVKNSSWSKNFEAEKMQNLVNDKIATKLAEQQLAKLKVNLNS